MRAILHSSQHPEYGSVTVPLPIPREDYDRTMELLEGLGIGDVLRQDRHVAELDSGWRTKSP